MIKKVLVVDDEPDVRFILQNLLKAQGFETDQSETVKSCLTKVQQFRPDLVILDIDLPDGSGLDALPLIKSQFPEVKVVMNSALDTSENRAVAKQNGADAFVGKPLNKQKLLQVLTI